MMTDEIENQPRRLAREPEFSRISGIAAKTLCNWRWAKREVDGVQWYRLGGRIIVYDLAIWEDALAAQRRSAGSGK